MKRAKTLEFVSVQDSNEEAPADIPKATSSTLVVPCWLAVCVALCTIASTSLTIIVGLAVSEAKPAISSVTNSVSDVLGDIHFEDLNTALKQSVTVLEFICGDLIDCEGV